MAHRRTDGIAAGGPRCAGVRAVKGEVGLIQAPQSVALRDEIPALRFHIPLRLFDLALGQHRIDVDPRAVHFGVEVELRGFGGDFLRACQ